MHTQCFRKTVFGIAAVYAICAFTAVHAEPLIKYAPPDRAAPKEKRVGGGTRASGSDQHTAALEFLAPLDHAGYSARAEPKVYLYSKDAGDIRFALHELQADANKVVQKLRSLDEQGPLSLRAGTQAIDFAALGLRLEAGKRYRLLAEPDDGAATAVAFIVWPGDDDANNAALALSDAADRLAHFSERGFWFDVVHECVAASGAGEQLVDESCAQIFKSMALNSSQ